VLSIPLERPTTVSTTRPSTARLASASIIGTLIETYDLVLYSLVAATVFGSVFFPNISPWVGTLAALVTHLTAFVMRPLGAVLFGYIGDRFSRIRALQISLLMMGAATVLIGLLPGAATLGVWAPILLVVLRLVQGLAVGGEFGGAVLVSTEHASPGKRAIFGTFANTGATSGGALAILVSVVAVAGFGMDAFTAYGWRIPFLLSAVLVVVGFFVRRIEEAPEFADAKAKAAATPRGAGPSLRRRFGYIGVAVLLIVPNVTLFYVIVTAFLAYVRSGGVPGLSVVAYQVATFVAMVLSVGVNIAGGFLASRFPRERIIVTAGVLAVVIAFPAVALIHVGTIPSVFAGVLFLIPAHGLLSGVATGYLSDSIPISFRYTGVGLGYALGAGLGGGALPLLLLWIVGPTGNLWPFAVLLAAVGLAGIGGVAAARRMRSTATEPDAA
jgi:MHS family shikimate/dehydroshikimate transporter-like MFS transporter